MQARPGHTVVHVGLAVRPQEAVWADALVEARLVQASGSVLTRRRRTLVHVALAPPTWRGDAGGRRAGETCG